MGKASCIAREMSKCAPLLGVLLEPGVSASTFLLRSLILLSLLDRWFSFSFRSNWRFLRAVCRKSPNSRSAKPPKVMADNSGDTYGGRFWPSALPPKPANQAPVALQIEISAFTPKERLRLVIPTERPTMKLSVEEASANRNASRNMVIVIFSGYTISSPLFTLQPLKIPLGLALRSVTAKKHEHRFQLRSKREFVFFHRSSHHLISKKYF